MPWWWAGVIGAAAVALGMRPWMGWLERQGMVDQPGPSRRLHSQPTPRGGGALIALALLGLGASQLPVFETEIQGVMLLAFLAMAAGLGWLEDRQPRPIRWRLAGQFAAGLLLVLALGPIDGVSVGSVVVPGQWVWTTLGCIAVVWLMNLHNFMDGSDGLAACQGIWMGLGFSVLFALQGELIWAWWAAGLAGACGGFLVWNRPIASVFMGDTGSYVVGGAVALLAYQAVASGQISIVICMMLTALFVVDATATLLRRVILGHRWYTPHASHAFQRLIAGGLSHAQLLMVFIGINVIWVLPMVAAAIRWPHLEAWFGAMVYATISFGWWQTQQQAGMPKQKG